MLPSMGDISCLAAACGAAALVAKMWLNITEEAVKGEQNISAQVMGNRYVVVTADTVMMSTATSVSGFIVL